MSTSEVVVAVGALKKDGLSPFPARSWPEAFHAFSTFRESGKTGQDVREA